MRSRFVSDRLRIIMQSIYQSKFKRDKMMFEFCLTIYHQVKNKVQDRRFPRTVKEALSALNISERTWRRKQKIAELMILDRSRFDEIASRMVRNAGGSRLNSGSRTLPRNDVRLSSPETLFDLLYYVVSVSLLF